MKTRIILLNIIFIFVLVNVSTLNLTAQESTDSGNKPVFGTFNSGIFLENQTTMMYPAKTLEIIINHRFGKIDDGFKELFGIYSPSNIRMGINYTFCKRFQLGLGTTKYNKQQDLNYKILLLEQTTNNKIPVNVTFFGSTFLDAREEATSFNYENFTYSHRFSFFNEIMISRKICEKASIQLAATYSHYNITESADATKSVRLRRNDQFGLSALGKFNVTPTIALVAEYDYNFTKLYRKEDNYSEPKPNFSIGIENTTAAHSFQLFITTAEAITYQHNMVYNQNEFNAKGLMLGFNITRVFYK